MENIAEIIKECGGRDAVAALVGVKITAVRFAEGQGKLPAMWFDAIERHIGRPVRRDLFSFKSAEEVRE